MVVLASIIKMMWYAGLSFCNRLLRSDHHCVRCCSFSSLLRFRHAAGCMRYYRIESDIAIVDDGDEQCGTCVKYEWIRGRKSGKIEVSVERIVFC